MNYFRKMRGVQKSLPAVSLSEIAWSWIGAFAGISAVASIHYNLLDQNDLVMLFVALMINNIPASRRYPQFWI